MELVTQTHRRAGHDANTPMDMDVTATGTGDIVNGSMTGHLALPPPPSSSSSQAPHPAPAPTPPPQQSMALVGVGAGGVGGGASVGQQSLVPRRAPTLPRPKWHAPWKLARVISGHLGWVKFLRKSFLYFFILKDFFFIDLFFLVGFFFLCRNFFGYILHSFLLS